MDGIKQLLARYLDEYLSVDCLLIDGFPFGELLHENDLFKGHSRESVLVFPIQEYRLGKKRMSCTKSSDRLISVANIQCCQCQFSISDEEWKRVVGVVVERMLILSFLPLPLFSTANSQLELV